MPEERKVPLLVSWLSEEGLLAKAVELLGYEVKEVGAQGPALLMPAGDVLTTTGVRKKLEVVQALWDDRLLFTIAQLVELGFELGDLAYCKNCSLLEADCDRERARILQTVQEGSC